MSHSVRTERDLRKTFSLYLGTLRPHKGCGIPKDGQLGCGRSGVVAHVLVSSPQILGVFLDLSQASVSDRIYIFLILFIPFVISLAIKIQCVSIEAVMHFLFYVEVPRLFIYLFFILKRLYVPSIETLYSVRGASQT